MADSASSTSEFGWLIDMIKHIVGSQGGSSGDSKAAPVVVPPTVSDQPKSAKAEEKTKADTPSTQAQAAPVIPAASAQVQPLANVVASVLPQLAMNPLANVPALQNLIAPQAKKASSAGAPQSDIGKSINSWLTSGANDVTSAIKSGASDALSGLGTLLGL